jgi:hypothetical protein
MNVWRADRTPPGHVGRSRHRGAEKDWFEARCCHKLSRRSLGGQIGITDAHWPRTSAAPHTPQGPTAGSASPRVLITHYGLMRLSKRIALVNTAQHGVGLRRRQPRGSADRSAHRRRQPDDLPRCHRDGGGICTDDEVLAARLRHPRDHVVSEDSFPAAEAWAAEELSLPMHPDVTADEVQFVASAVNYLAAQPTARSGEARC